NGIRIAGVDRREERLFRRIGRHAGQELIAESRPGRRRPPRDLKAAAFLPAEFNAAAHFVDRNVAEGRGDAPAYVFEGRTLSYAELLELVDRAGNALVQQGVGRGDRVLLLCLDAPEFVGAFWGAIKLGAVPVSLNTL